MDKKRRLDRYVNKALIRLRFEKAVHMMQTGLFAASLMAVLIYAASRLFVLLGYGDIAWMSAGLVLVVALFITVYQRYRKAAAIQRLDDYMPDNLLITAMDAKVEESHLAPALIDSAISTVGTAYEQFKKREKRYVNPKMLGGFVVLSVILTLLIMFPSEAQLEAGAIEKEQEIIEDMKKEVQELVKKEPPPEVKKELEDLAKKLEEAKLSEEALKELVKKQKELKLKEQRLSEKKAIAESSGDPADALTEEELLELAELLKLSDQLAKNAGKAHTALNEIGKAPALPALANAGTSSTGEGSSGGNGATPGESTGESEGSGEGTAEENASTGIQGEGSGQEAGEGTGLGASQGSGSGTGQGTGQGTGSAGQGQGSQGPGVGIGSGGRNLLSIPFDRIGGKTDPSLVKGQHGKGDFIEERDSEGPVEKGTIRPYSEVVGEYRESYLKSTDKMKLPPDLQHVLSDYFSSIE